MNPTNFAVILLHTTFKMPYQTNLLEFRTKVLICLYIFIILSFHVYLVESNEVSLNTIPKKYEDQKRILIWFDRWYQFCLAGRRWPFRAIPFKDIIGIRPGRSALRISINIICNFLAKCKSISAATEVGQADEEQSTACPAGSSHLTTVLVPRLVPSAPTVQLSYQTSST